MGPGAGPPAARGGRSWGPLPALIAAGAGAVLASGLPALTAPSPPGPAQGAELAAALGCGGCHAGLPAPTAARDHAPPFGPGAPALPATFVFEYLADPVPRRQGIAPARMPDFGLDEGERLALALFLGEDDGALEAARAAHPGVDARRGRAVFEALGCAGCHAHAEVDAAQAGPDLSGVARRVRGDWLRRYLAGPVRIRPALHARMPDFGLDGSEVEALAAALGSPGARASTGPARPTAHEAVRARRLLDSRVACLGCHRLEGEGGRLGPPLDGVGERLLPVYVEAIIDRPHEVAPRGGMPPQPLPPGTAALLARHLLASDAPWAPPETRSLAEVPMVELAAATAAASGGGAPPGGPGADEDAATGATIYARRCAACHGVTGQGDGWNADALPVRPTVHADPGVLSERPDDTLFDAIHAGGWVVGRSPRMPAFGLELAPAEIRAVVAYLRELCACRGPAWSRDGGGAP